MSGQECPLEELIFSIPLVRKKNKQKSLLAGGSDSNRVEMGRLRGGMLAVRPVGGSECVLRSLACLARLVPPYKTADYRRKPPKMPVAYQIEFEPRRTS